MLTVLAIFSLFRSFLSIPSKVSKTFCDIVKQTCKDTGTVSWKGQNLMATKAPVKISEYFCNKSKGPVDFVAQTDAATLLFFFSATFSDLSWIFLMCSTECVTTLKSRIWSLFVMYVSSSTSRRSFSVAMVFVSPSASAGLKLLEIDKY